MIPSKLYKQIVESVPILCVDVILIHDGKYILVKRKNEPLKGDYWIVGGRALKGERTEDSAIRKVKEELGLEMTHLEFCGVYEDHYQKSAWGIPTSSFSAVYRAEVEDFKPQPDKTIEKVKLSEDLPKRLLDNMKWL